MVDIDGQTSNRQTVTSDDLSALVETLADWEYELQRLDPADRVYLGSDLEEPAP